MTQKVTINLAQKDSDVFDQQKGYERRCIDGKMTGCGNCVGYCQYDGHKGFLTDRQRVQHQCLEKNCLYYVEKPEKSRKRHYMLDGSKRVIEYAEKLTANMEGMRVMSAKRNGSDYIVRYVTVSGGYPIERIEKQLAEIMGQNVRMKQIICDFERAAELVFCA